MNKAVKSVVMVLGIGAFLQVFGVASATWTGAENGFWTNANNWVDGQIGGRWLVRDAGGNLATNGVKGSTAYFGAEGAAGATMGAGMGLGMGIGVGHPMGSVMAQMSGNINVGQPPVANPAGAKFCVSCGGAVVPNAKFCPGCGARIG